MSDQFKADSFTVTVEDSIKGLPLFCALCGESFRGHVFEVARLLDNETGKDKGPVCSECLQVIHPTTK